MNANAKRVPRCDTNPAAGMIADTIEHFGLKQSEVAKAMRVSPGLLSEIIHGKRGVSAEFALRFEHCLGVSAEWVLKTQSFYDYCNAHHQKSALIVDEVTRLKQPA